MNKKGLAPMFLLIVIAGAIALFSMADIGDLTASISGGSGTYVERPVFKYIKCEQVGEYGYSVDYSLPQGDWVIPPATSSSYDVVLTGKTMFGFSSFQWNYYVCPQRSIQSNCQLYNKKVTGTTATVSNVPGSYWVWAEYQRAGISTLLKWEATTGTYKVGFQPYALREYNVLGGSPNLLNAGSCELNTNVNGWIKSEDITSISAPTGSVYSTEDIFKVNEVRWFLAGYVTSASDGVDLGDGTWCRDMGTTGSIYKLNTVVTSTGTYKIADPQYNNLVKSVACCPGDISGTQRCTSDFKWQETAQQECSAFNSCGAVDYQPNGQQSVIRYSCESGKCVSQTKEVECSSDLDCESTLKLCDKTTWSCVDADVNLNGEKVIRMPDSVQDCEKAGGTWIRKTEEKQSILSFIGIGSPKIIITEYCSLKKSNLSVWIIWIIVLITILFLWKPIFAGIKIIASKIGVRF